jgi:hypothetical protein
VEINGGEEWFLVAFRCFQSGAATIEQLIAVENRSHDPKTTGTKLQDFFSDQTGRLRPAAALV